MLLLQEKKLLTLKEVNKQPVSLFFFSYLQTIITVNINHPWLQKYSEYLEHFKNEAVKHRSGEITPPSTDKTAVHSVFKINKIMKYLFLDMQMDPDGLYEL